MGEGAGAQAAAPAIEKGLVVAVPVFFEEGEMVGDVLGDEPGSEDAGGEGVCFVEGADFDALFVAENGEVDGSGEMVVSEFEGGADVDDAGDFLHGEGEGDGFEFLHRVGSCAMDLGMRQL